MSKRKRGARQGRSGLITVREPNGRLSRSALIEIEAVSPAQARRLRDAAVKGMAAPEWATELGRMYLAGGIGSELYEAGRRWGRLVLSYYKAIGAKPPYPKGQNFEHFEPAHPPELNGAEQRRETHRVRAIVGDMREAHAVLIGAGMVAERAVRMLCEEDDAPIGAIGIKELVHGLSWLASYWGLTDERLAR